MTALAKRALLAAALLVALSAAAAGCGGGSASGDGAGDPGQSGGTLRWAIEPNSSWDPVTNPAGSENRHLQLVYEALVRVDERGFARPGIASGWEFSEDGRTLTFTLRRGVRFSDGAPVDAEAVEQNLERAKTQRDSAVTQLLAAVRSIDVVDRHTVRLDLDRPDYGLPLVLSGKAGMLVSPRALAGDLAEIARRPVGAGPYVLEKWVPDASAKLVTNPGYYKADEVHLDGVELKYLTDPQAILAGLQSGGIDLTLFGGDQLESAKRAGLGVTEQPSLEIAQLMVNDAMEPFDDHRVAEAMNHAIDREALLRVQQGGIGEPSYQVFPRGYVGYSDEVADLYPYDPEKARALLTEAGYPNGFSVKLSYYPYRFFKAMAEQLQAQLAEVGIRTELELVPLAQAADRLFVKHEAALAINDIAGRESPLQMLDVQYGADGLLNPGRRASPELTRAIVDAAAHELDSPEYPRALQAVTARAARESAVIFLFTEPRLWVHTDKVSGLRPFVSSPRLDGVRLAG